MHFSFLTSHLNTGLCLTCVRGTYISGLTKEILILVLWKTHCAQKLTTSFNCTNDQVTEKVIQFITNLIAFWDEKKKGNNRKNLSKWQGAKGINGRQPGLAGGYQRLLLWCIWSWLRRERLAEHHYHRKAEVMRLKAWLHWWAASANITVPSQITAAYPILVIWRLWRKSPFNCCAWPTWRNNKFSKQNLFSKQLPWPASGWARVCCREQYTGHALAFGCSRRSWKIWRSLKWRRSSIQQQGTPDPRQGWTPFCIVLELEKYSHAEIVSCSACCRDWPGAGEDKERTVAKKIIYLKLPFANCSKRREGR